MAIVTSKAQTTRHRMLGIINTEDVQIVLSDTPGIIDQPAYKMQEAMNASVAQAFDDADILLYLVTPEESPESHSEFIRRIKSLDVPKFLVLNKIDALHDSDKTDEILEPYRQLQCFDQFFKISALHGTGVDLLYAAIVATLPEGPVYFPKDQLSDRPERFFVTEIIRENILKLYHQEIPYSCEVIIEEYRENQGRTGEQTHIRAIIYVDRKTQKPILIGKGGESIKALGIASRKGIEEFLGVHVHLELFVKVKPGWRDDQWSLKEFGYR